MRVLGLVLVVLGVASHSLLARAQGAIEARVSVTLVGRGPLLGEFARLLAESNPQLVVHQAAFVRATEIFDSTTSAELRVWLVVVPGFGAKIYFAEPTGKRFLVREVPLASGLDESGREILAQVVATSVKAFVDRQASSTRFELESSLRADQEQPLADVAARPQLGRVRLHGTVVTARAARGTTRRQTWHTFPGFSYAAQLVSSDTVAHGPGILVGVTRGHGAWWWLAAAEGQYRFPLAIEAAGLTLSLHSWTFGAKTALERLVSADWALGGELSMLIERTEFNLSEIPRATVRALPTGVHFRPHPYAGLRAGYDLGAVRITLCLGAEVALARTHYDLGNRPIFTPWLLSPRSAIELGWQ
jgi:hypothetical protein